MPDIPETLITHHNPKSPVSEAFRTLRTNLQFTSVDKPVRTVLVTSAGPGEGKTTVAANLAIAVAQAGRKVVLVDADLRRGRLHKIFNLPNRAGLSNILVGAVGMEAIQETSIPGLKVLASGPFPPNPSELLGSPSMERVIGALCAEADMVIFDAPPVVAVTDAAVLGPKVDGVLMVLSLGVAVREMAQRAKVLMQNVNARILGVVVNNIDPSNGYGYYYYYYYYYYYSQDQDRDQDEEDEGGRLPAFQGSAAGVHND